MKVPVRQSLMGNKCTLAIMRVPAHFSDLRIGCVPGRRWSQSAALITCRLCRSP